MSIYLLEDPSWTTADKIIVSILVGGLLIFCGWMFWRDR